MNRKVITVISGTLVILGITVVLLINLFPTDIRVQTSQADEALTRNNDNAVRVQVTQPVIRTLFRELRMPASLLADEQVDLYAKVSGYIQAVHVDFGSRVHKGNVLIEISVPEMVDELKQAQAILQSRQATIQAAKSQVTQAQLGVQTSRAKEQSSTVEEQFRRITFQRKEKLHKDKAITDQAFDEAKSKLAMAEAQLVFARAKVNSALSEETSAKAEVTIAEAEAAVAQATVARLKTLMKYAIIKAPFDGVIVDRLVDHGAFVRSAAEGTTPPLLTIAKVDRIRLALDIPEPDAPFARVGTKVDIHVKALNEHLDASITRTAVALKPDTRTMLAEIDLDNKDGRLAPGMYAQVVIKLQAKENALLVPSKAIRVRGRDTFVLVASGHVAKSVPVKLGYDDGIWAEIVSGLVGKEWIITSASGAVAPGAPIDPVPN